MTSVTISTQSIEEFVSFLGEVKQLEFIDRAVWESVGEQLKIQTEKRFAAQIDPDGNAWTPLSEKYQKRKAKKATHHQLLKFSGYLLDTLHHQADDHGVKFGSNRIYARTHQFGDDHRNIPARPFLGINQADKKAIIEELHHAWQAWLAEQS